MFEKLQTSIADKLEMVGLPGMPPEDIKTMKLSAKPQNVSPKKAAEFMVGKKNIMVLTGAGISAASGIPTFRGESGFWKKSYNGINDPMKLCTRSHFNVRPEDTWAWHWDFIELTDSKTWNEGHVAITRLQEFTAQQRSAHLMLVT